jgi:hypothetical protein
MRYPTRFSSSCFDHMQHTLAHLRDTLVRVSKIEHGQGVG